jgi:REP element-mobilizing transposase RayT
VEGGWYHITTRGMFRKEIFENDRDREHFVELLALMVERYCVVLHAYVLMDMKLTTDIENTGAGD